MNALLGLQVALGELQAAAGPDQRVTANAEILEGGYSSVAPIEGKAQWSGVWKTNDFDPSNPLTKTFVGWLASNSVEEDTLDRAEAAFVQPIEMVSAKERSDGTTTLTVPAVQAERVSTTNDEMAYAWVVLDEGVKAKVSPNAWEREAAYSASGQLSQALRFGPSEVAGLNALEGLELFEAEVSIDDREKLLSLASVAIASGGSEIETSYFHDLTTQSFGVLSDVRNGGLKRDLSRGLGEQFASKFEGRNLLPGPSPVMPLKWDAVKAYYDLYKLLENADTTNPVLNPSSTVTLYTEDNGRGEFVPDENVALKDGVVKGWNLDQHPIAPVVQQFIWRIGGMGGQWHESGGVVWTGIPSPRKRPSANYLEEHASTDFGRQLISPMVVLWNPYNVTLDVSDFRVTYNPAFEYKLNVRDDSGLSVSPSGELIDPAESSNLYDLWLESESLSYSDHFSVELLSNYDRPGRSLKNPEQTLLNPGEMKIFGLHFETASSKWDENNYFGGGIGGWSDNPDVPQLLGPKNGNTYSNFRAGFNARDIKLNQYSLGWVHDSVELELPASIDPEDFRLVLSISNAASTTNSAEGYVVRDVSGLIPNLSGVQTFSFAGSLGGKFDPFTLADYNEIFRDSRYDTSYAENLWAANLVATLKTSDAMYGEGTVPFLAQFNPLAWHSRSTTEQPHSPIWDVRLFDRNDWNNVFLNSNSAVPNGVATWGNSTGFSGQERVVLKEIPRQPLWSVGQLMHSDIGVVDTAPLYTVGASYAPPFGSFNVTEYTDDTVDLAWHYNDALFDSYFFSTVPELGQDLKYPPFKVFNGDFISSLNPLPNSRLHFYRSSDQSEAAHLAALKDTESAAANLLVDGAFNVNSTSVDAWKSVLSSLRQTKPIRVRDTTGTIDSDASLTPAEVINAIPRFLHPMASNENSGDGSEATAWAGFRSLEDSELTDLAAAIVDEVKLRGPFLSMADFVNRRLTNDATGRSGALQAALDNTVNDPLNFGGSPTDSTLPETSNFAPASGAGAPGWVLQNDVLQSLAPVMTVRSDTFKIRAYGEAGNTASGDVNRVWCEIVVQRYPDWVDVGTDKDAFRPPTSAINLKYGRQFEVLSFRWLEADEI